MVYQHGSPFYDEDEESCRVHAQEGQSQLSRQQSVSGTYTNLLILDTGCLDLLPKNIIPWMI